MFVTPNEVVYRGAVTLSGQINSPDSSCEDAEEVVIRRRITGQGEFRDFAVETTDADGRFEVVIAPRQSAQYVTVAPRHDQCTDATSEPETMLVKVKVVIRASRYSAPRDARVRIYGRVRPDHDGTTVVLQRRRGERFISIRRDDLDERSRYRFVVEVDWRRRRAFRVLWRSQDDEHATNRSRNVVIRGTR